MRTKLMIKLTLFLCTAVVNGQRDLSTFPNAYRSSSNSNYGGSLQQTQIKQRDGPIDEPANYDFQYEIYGGGNSYGHQESRRDQKASGRYHVLLPDGRRQVVSYVADETGYHPTITYEDPNNDQRSNNNRYSP